MAIYIYIYTWAGTLRDYLAPAGGYIWAGTLRDYLASAGGYILGGTLRDYSSTAAGYIYIYTYIQSLTSNCADGRSRSPKCVGTPNCVEL